MSNILERQFSYDAWANREVAKSFHSVPSVPPKALKWLGHIVAAESLWYERIHDLKQSLPVWPELSLGECEAQIERMAALWPGLLQKGQTTLDKEIEYKNSAGQSWSSRTEDILLHVIAHSAYHRGQIAAEMRPNGYQPAHTDFIHAVRNKLV